MLKTFLLVVVLLPLIGCARLAPVRDAGVRVASGYCQSPPAGRLVFREEIAELGKRVCITDTATGERKCGATLTLCCPGDPCQEPAPTSQLKQY